MAASLLPSGMELAHPAVEVALPTVEHALVVLYRPAQGNDKNFHGWVLGPGKPGCYKRYELPKMKEAPKLFDIEVKSIFGANCGTKTKRALVVLYEYHRNGQENNSGSASYVYRWTSNGFVSDEALRRRVVGLKTAEQVRAKLRTACTSK